MRARHSGVVGGGVANVFLSYAGEDRALARTVHGWLVEAGHETFAYLHPHDGVPPGEQWEPQLYERLRWADAMVCVVTSAHVASTWCTAELSIARARKLRLLPIRAEPEVRHPLLPSTQYIDYARDPDAARATVIEALRRAEAPAPGSRSAFPRLRWPHWVRRARWLSRRTIAGLAGATVAIGLGVAGLLLVIDHGTVDAATQRERDADPCALLDLAVLREFGTPAFTTPQYLQSCRATITSAGHETLLQVSMESAISIGTLIKNGEPVSKVDNFDVQPEKKSEVSDRHKCTYRLWLTEDQPVVAIEALNYDEQLIDLCAVSDAAVKGAISRLILIHNRRIPYTEDRTENYSHARADACELLDSTALSKVPGLNLYNVEPGYGHWSCTWRGSDDRAEVTLGLSLKDTTFDDHGADGVTINGKSAQVSNTGDYCDADVAHRHSPGRDQDTEMLRLGVKAPRSPEELCVLVTDLASTAEKELAD